MLGHIRKKHFLLTLFCSGILLAAVIHNEHGRDVTELLASPVREPNVHVKLQKLTGKESVRTFGKDLTSYAYQPITLTIYNDSDDLLLLRSSSINMPLEQASTIINAAQHSTFLTTCLTTSLSAIYFWPAIVPAVGVGLWMSWDNRKFHSKVASVILEDDMAFEILPYEHFVKTFFVAADAIPNEGSLHLFNVHKKIFIPYTFAL